MAPERVALVEDESVRKDAALWHANLFLSMLSPEQWIKGVEMGRGVVYNGSTWGKVGNG